MGEAKRRGTRERRIAQSLERTRLEDEARRATLQREDEERRARIAALPPEERKAVIMGNYILDSLGPVRCLGKGGDDHAKGRDQFPEVREAVDRHDSSPIR
jgi:hypothetical protein